MKLLKQIHSIRIDCSAIEADSAWLRKYGKRIKAVGGRYSDIRGSYSNKRFVYMPVSSDTRTLIAEIIDTGCHQGAKTTVVVGRFEHRLITRREGNANGVRMESGTVLYVEAGTSEDYVSHAEAHVEKALQRMWAEDQKKPMQQKSAFVGARRYAIEGDKNVTAQILDGNIDRLTKSIAAQKLDIVAKEAKLAALIEQRDGKVA